MIRQLKMLVPALLAVGGALGVSILAILILGDNPGRSIVYLIAGPAMNPLALGNTLAAASRLAIAGTAAALAFRSGTFNLGGEGQALAGGLAVAVLALLLPEMPRMVAVPAAILAGMGAGAVVGGVSGMLKARWQVDEMISSFLLASVLLPVGHYLLSGPLKDPGSYLIAAPPLGRNWVLPSWLPPSRFGPVLLWAAAVIVLIWFFISYTRPGYQWRLRGANEAFARYGGIRTGLIAAVSMSASGALYGLAGTAALMDSGQAVQGFSGGLGWDGLAVAMIASSRPEWILPAALAYAWLSHGTQAAVFNTGFPYSLGGLVQAVVFLLITATALESHRRRRA